MTVLGGEIRQPRELWLVEDLQGTFYVAASLKPSRVERVKIGESSNLPPGGRMLFLFFQRQQAIIMRQSVPCLAAGVQ